MTPQTDPMETLLETLGKARRDGAFSSDAAQYPWQADQAKVISVAHRRLAWVRVAVPLAAAAAVAVLFVGPSLFETPAVEELAETIHTSVLPVHPEVLAEAPDQSPTTAETVDCDYNGDGRVDGRDIQAFLSRVQEDAAGDLEIESEFLRRCLLSNGG
ncbi:MAG: hypothetical protein ABII12_16970 [Planctomycetota bacterium]